MHLRLELLTSLRYYLRKKTQSGFVAVSNMIYEEKI